ncbi:MAG: glycosyltransferase [Ruminococcus sp.]|nr:glycosyltransferase [Ruminococcus sp.]
MENACKENCKVSVILPSLNVAEYIEECIESALNQTLGAKEIICVDAGSTDGTWEILSSYAKNPQYKDQMILIHSNIKSYGYQVNIGIQKASGEYIAILETDDYVVDDMYEYLYQLGVSCDADYVKADYDAFITSPSNKKKFEAALLFKNEKEKYNRVINPSHDAYLYTNDCNIWKGIYKRSFLVEHDIFLNESKGAAFQDIGFMLQVLSCAKRAVYSDKSFYRYRMDREQSSIYSIHRLQYSYQEFARLLEEEDIKKKLIYIDGIFQRMTHIFFDELIKSLRVVEYDADSELIKPYYLWFKKQLTDAINQKSLSIDLYQFYPELPLLLSDIYEFSSKIKEEDRILAQKRKELIDTIGEKSVILFGLGAYGTSAMEFLYDHNIKILAACDNNKTLWHTERDGFLVYAPTECVKKFPGHIYIIANKRYGKEIERQLLDLGIRESNIFLYPADIL